MKRPCCYYRLTKVLGNSAVHESDLDEAFGNIQHYLKGMELLERGSPQSLEQFFRDTGNLEMIRSCLWASSKNQSDCKVHFKHVLTNSGICSSFNANPFNSSLVESDHNKLFAKYYKTQPEGATIAMNTGSGTRFNMVLVLNAHSTAIFGASKGKFKVGMVRGAVRPCKNLFSGNLKSSARKKAPNSVEKLLCFQEKAKHGAGPWGKNMFP